MFSPVIYIIRSFYRTNTFFCFSDFCTKAETQVYDIAARIRFLLDSRLPWHGVCVVRHVLAEELA